MLYLCVISFSLHFLAFGLIKKRWTLSFTKSSSSHELNFLWCLRLIWYKVQHFMSRYQLQKERKKKRKEGGVFFFFFLSFAPSQKREKKKHHSNYFKRLKKKILWFLLKEEKKQEKRKSIICCFLDSVCISQYENNMRKCISQYEIHDCKTSITVFMYLILYESNHVSHVSHVTKILYHWLYRSWFAFLQSCISYCDLKRVIEKMLIKFSFKRK